VDIQVLFVLGMFATFGLLLISGYPVAWVLAGTAVIWAVVGHVAVEYYGADLWYSWQSGIPLVPERTWGLVSSTTLVALPLFIFMGIMLDQSGVAERLMKSMIRLFGNIRGGHAVTIIVIGILLAASTGIIGASVVLLGMMSLPVMMQARYAKSFAVGTVCAVGCLGILMPPSIMLVLMADQLARPETSVGDLFMGAVFPAALLGVLYIIYALMAAWISPKLAPAPESAEKVSWRVLVDVVIAVVPTALLIVGVLGSIFFGIATPTEASGVGAAGATLLALLNRRLNWGVLRNAVQQTTRTSAFIFAIFLGATAFSIVLRDLGGDEVISEGLLALPFGPYGVLATILAIVFLLGFFLDWVEITLIVLPLVAPVIESLGFNLAWFTILFAICLQTSFLTPPVGFALFYVRGACPPEIGVIDIYKGVVPYIILQLIGLALVVAFPALVTWLPGVAFGR
jgi:tripartite ATP-independent transporter DctM subunit